tara:strand:- start:889 stop:1263 length:375 start_codon:yes stop_codon:yes gene_type:complete
MKITIVEALIALKPKAQFILRGDTYAGLEWLDETQTKPTEDEINAKITELEAAEPARQVREIRDRLLAESDWTQNRDVVLLNDITWKRYRQDLRDLPASASFTPKLDSNGNLDMSSVTWPLKPS